MTNTALIAEYLALVHFTQSPTEEQFRRMNAMALQLSMELPASIWSAVARSFQTPTHKGAWAVVDAVRRGSGLGPVDPELVVMHSRGETMQ